MRDDFWQFVAFMLLIVALYCILWRRPL